MCQVGYILTKSDSEIQILSLYAEREKQDYFLWEYLFGGSALALHYKYPCIDLTL